MTREGESLPRPDAPAPASLTILAAFLFAVCHEYWHGFDDHFLGSVRTAAESPDSKPQTFQAAVELLADWYSARILVVQFVERFVQTDVATAERNFRSLYVAISLGFSVMDLNDQSDSERPYGALIGDHPAATLRWALIDRMFMQYRADWRLKVRNELLHRILAVADEQRWEAFSALGLILVEAEKLEITSRPRGPVMNYVIEILEEAESVLSKEHFERLCRANDARADDEQEDTPYHLQALRLAATLKQMSMSEETRLAVDRETACYEEPLRDTFERGPAIGRTMRGGRYHEERLMRTAMLIQAALLIEGQ